MMNNLKDMLDYGTDTLQKAGRDNARTDAWYLLSYCMKISKAEYYTMTDKAVDQGDVEKYAGLISERASGKPLQYITGSQEFMGLEFYVDESVLIPRQDTETAVECALSVICDMGNDQSKSGRRILKVLDMCTGSGCIAVSIAKLAKDNTDIEVFASDISVKALDVALFNAKKNDVHVKFIESDMWEAFLPEDRYDIVISNPPYINSGVIPTLMTEVKSFEPVTALDGGEDGLDFYRKITAGLRDHLNDNGTVIYEIGYDQGERVSGLLRANGFADIKVIKDLAGLDRVVTAVCKSIGGL